MDTDGLDAARLDERERMVREQLQRAWGRPIRDPRVLATFRRVPREGFVPRGYQRQAYRDSPLPIGFGQTISQPYMVAYQLETLGLRGGERVLEIGTGSGYQTALLADLVKQDDGNSHTPAASGRVFSIERLDELTERARQALVAAGVPVVVSDRGEVAEEPGTRVHLRTGDGTLGWPEVAPFDGIVVSAASPEVPPALVAQLRVGGRLCIPVGPSGLTRLKLVTRTAEGAEIADGTWCSFVRLIGRDGYPE